MSPCRSATLLAQFPRGRAVYTVTDPSGHCSCDLFQLRPAVFDEERERARYGAKGWSAAKIDRAIMGRRPKETRYDRFRGRIAALVESSGRVEICTVDGHDDDVPRFPSAKMTLAEYLGSGGAYPHSTIVSIRAA